MLGVTADAVSAALAVLGGIAERDVPLASFTTYRVGGPAAVLVRPPHRPPPILAPYVRIHGRTLHQLLERFVFAIPNQAKDGRGHLVVLPALVEVPDFLLGERLGLGHLGHAKVSHATKVSRCLAFPLLSNLGPPSRLFRVTVYTRRRREMLAKSQPGEEPANR